MVAYENGMCQVRQREIKMVVCYGGVVDEINRDGCYLRLGEREMKAVLV